MSKIDSDPQPIIIESDKESMEWESNPKLKLMELESKPKEDLEVAPELEDDPEEGPLETESEPEPMDSESKSFGFDPD